MAFTTDDIYLYIFNWKKVTNNSIALHKILSKFIKHTTIINCDDNTQIPNAIQLDDSYYYGGQFETAITNVPKGKIFAVITGDVKPVMDAKKIAKNCVGAFNVDVMVYAPDVNTPHSKCGTLLRDMLYHVPNTDCTFWFIHPSIVQKLQKIPYKSISNFGWGIDIIVIEEAKKHGKHVVRDYAVRVEQPEGTGYSRAVARTQMNALIKYYGGM